MAGPIRGASRSGSRGGRPPRRGSDPGPRRLCGLARAPPLMIRPVDGGNLVIRRDGRSTTTPTDSYLRLELLLQGRAAGVDDHARHHVRVAVGVRAAILDVALLVHFDLPRDPHRGATVGHAVAEGVPCGRLVRTRETVLDVGAVA